MDTTTKDSSASYVGKRRVAYKGVHRKHTYCWSDTCQPCGN